MTKEKNKNWALGRAHFYCKLWFHNWLVVSSVSGPWVLLPCGSDVMYSSVGAHSGHFSSHVYRICFLLYVSKVCCPRCKYSMGIKLAWYFFFLFGLALSKTNGPSMSIFNTLHSLLLWCWVFTFCFVVVFFPGAGGGSGLSWGNCPLNFKWHYRKTQKGDGLCCALYRMPSWPLFPCPPVRSEAVYEIWIACHLGWWWA